MASEHPRKFQSIFTGRSGKKQRKHQQLLSLRRNEREKALQRKKQIAIAAKEVSDTELIRLQETFSAEDPQPTPQDILRIPKIIELLWSDQTELWTEILLILMNITYTSYCSQIVSVPLIKALQHILRTNDSELQEKVFWILANIGGDNVELAQELMMRCGIFQQINALMGKVSNESLESIAWMMHNICSDGFQQNMVINQWMLQLTNNLLKTLQQKRNLKAALCDALDAMVCLIGPIDFDSDHPMIKILIREKVLRNVCSFLNVFDDIVRKNICIIIGNVFAGKNGIVSPEQLSKIIPSLLDAISVAFAAQAKHLHLLLWALSNICAGSISQIHAILSSKNTNTMMILSSILKLGRYTNSKEALFTFANISDHHDQSKFICEQIASTDVIPNLCIFFNRTFGPSSENQKDLKTLSTALECIQNILEISKRYKVDFEEGNILKTLDFIQSSITVPEHITQAIDQIIAEIDTNVTFHF